jgi:N-methylhydantoinase A
VAVRVGVDVGGTFTKAVACDAHTGAIVARAVTPTTREGGASVAAGVVRAVGEVAAAIERDALGPVLLVAHSTTHAVNALLEGDTTTVGVLGLGRRPDARRARRRTRVGDVRLAPGRRLETRHAFVDTSDGLRRDEVGAALQHLVDDGAQALCVSEAFGVDDPVGERMALEVAAELGLPACAGHELSGLYGLELRTVTAALNAGILPTSLSVAATVQGAVAQVAPGAPLLVMKGDGGAADVAAARRAPLLTAFSGPAASVAGALRRARLRDAVVVEVGGTSTNVSVVRDGRPSLSYVRVLDHVTSVRSLDVRVVGVAGGSLVRLETGRRRTRLADVGPRSAHIAGLEYCAFARPDEMAGARAVLCSPRPGDPADYAVIETAAGRRVAPTVTCAATALGAVVPGSYAAGDRAAARLGFDALGRVWGVDGATAARLVLERAGAKIAAVVAEALGEHARRARATHGAAVVGLGGGAGALVPVVAQGVGAEWTIPADAEVISSVGDALSLVRVEEERTVPASDPAGLAELVGRVERAAVRSGAAAGSIEVETEPIPERGAVRAVARGAVALASDAGGGEPAAEPADRLGAASAALGGDPRLLADTGFYSVFAHGAGAREQWAIVDGRGALAASGEGTIVSGSGSEVMHRLDDAVPALVRHFGPVAVGPAIRILNGARLVDLASLSSPPAALEAARRECASANGNIVVAFLSRT